MDNSNKKLTVAVIGGGGREYAIAKRISESERTGKLYVIPGNGGMDFAECVAITATDVEGVCAFCVKNDVDFVVVTPDDPLALGMVNALESRGIDCFGCTKESAIIEASKAFAKDFMKKYSIPTADYRIFDNAANALSYLEQTSYPTVIKADGLALGKGVIIASDKAQAVAAVHSIMEEKAFGNSGNTIVIEEFLEGAEISLLTLTDGKAVVCLPASMDHKKVFDGDEGLNTGGMGAVAPNPYFTPDVQKECLEKIVFPTVEGMKKEGRTFVGCLYFGLMLTAKGVKVIEYNCRFGDPETQAVLPLVKGDLLEFFLCVREGKLADCNIEFENKFCCCVCMTSGGYPQAYKKGYEIDIPDDVAPFVCIAGAKKAEGKLLTAGGRVLNVLAVADTLDKAVETAYQRTREIHFENAYYRKDIGQRALNKLKRS
ncbi:MAG: phosphoribosylamine--glycine ligase [Clostridia bacterium]|nr:phosphoribosylamine--glycine ligase [Clostridia bacterium]